MTTLERVELAVRRTANKAPYPMAYWLLELATELADQCKSENEAQKEKQNA